MENIYLLSITNLIDLIIRKKSVIYSFLLKQPESLLEPSKIVFEVSKKIRTHSHYGTSMQKIYSATLNTENYNILERQFQRIKARQNAGLHLFTKA